MAREKKWRKILYEDQGVPDNYVDESFLDEMKKNLNIRTYDFWTVVVESGVVTQQLSSVCIFVMCFVYMDQHWLSPHTLFAVSSLLSVAGYLLYGLIGGATNQTDCKRTRLADLKTACVFIGFSFGLSPVLMTLTDTISTDTIYAMTACMLVANLLFHDYDPTSAQVSGTVSLNAAIFASVCLASRLHTAWHSFATVTFAVEIFALWPMLRTRLKTQMPFSQVVMTATLGCAAAVCILSVSTICGVLFTVACVFITFVCPAWLISLQPYKNNIYGPWDEAVIKD